MNLIRRFIRWIPFRLVFGPLVRLASEIGLVAPLFSWLLVRAIEEWQSDTPPVTNQITILALSGSRFRKDLDILAGTGEVRVLVIPQYWQTRIIYTFYPDGTDRAEIFRPDHGSRIAKRQRALHRLLRSVLRRVYSKLGVDAVIGAAFHYKEDVDFGAASQQIGTPYVVFHRECFVASKSLRQGSTQFFRRLNRFPGALIIVHNEHTRRVLMDAGVVKPEFIRALGTLRMDDYIRRIVRTQTGPIEPRPRKLVTFFSFGEGYGQFGEMPMWSRDGKEGLVQLFVRAHVEFALLAQRLREVDFVIKPKWGGNWVQRIHAALEIEGIEVSQIANLSVIADADAQSLILESNVIAAFGSTVILEAAVAGKPVVVPLFEEAAEPEFKDWMVIPDSNRLFDVAISSSQFGDLIESRLNDWQPDDKLMRERRALFEDWVSALDGKATERYVEALRDTSAAAVLG